MSLVGTRPILQDELRQYELHHRARIAIKPGITGMWQVSGRSDITDFEEVVRLDTEYISKKICDEINALKPDFLWVGIGAPKQEMWMWQHQEKINNTVMFGVGAGFNFFAGTLDKAPEWMEKASLEWLFRLSKEPKRLWRRYILGGFKYLYYTAEYKLKKKK